MPGSAILNRTFKSNELLFWWEMTKRTFFLSSKFMHFDGKLPAID